MTTIKSCQPVTESASSSDAMKNAEEALAYVKLLRMHPEAMSPFIDIILRLKELNERISTWNIYEDGDMDFRRESTNDRGMLEAIGFINNSMFKISNMEYPDNRYEVDPYEICGHAPSRYSQVQG